MKNNTNLIKNKINYLFNTKYIFESFSLIYYFCLSFSYILFRKVYFDYGDWFNIDTLKLVQITFLFFALLQIIPKNINRISDLFVSIIFFIIIIPAFVIFSFDTRYEWFSIFSILTTFILILVVRKYDFFKKFRINNIYKYRNKVFFFLYLFSALGILFLFFDVGLNSFNLNPKLVYDFRDQDFSRLGSYAINWLSKISIPFITCLAIKNKNYVLIAICSFSLLFLYGISAEKSILLFPFLGIITSLWFEKFKNLSFIPFFILLLMVIAFVLYFVFGYSYVPSMIIRRGLFIPSSVILHYLKFFGENQFTYWSQNLIGNLFSEYPYNLPPGELINQRVFSLDAGSSNCSFFGTAYMQAGFLGSVIYGLIMGITFNFIDYFSLNKNNFLLVASMSSVPIFTIITSTDLPTGFLTHGLFISLIVIPLLSEKDYLIKKIK